MGFCLIPQLIMASQIKCLTLNVRGLKDSKKRREIFYWLRKQKHDVIFLQETHCHSKKLEYCWTREWDGQSVWGLGTNNSKGVAILFNRNHLYDVSTVFKDPNGRIIVVDLNVDNNILRLLNVYGPNTVNERIEFYDNHVNNYLDTDSPKIVGGDFNCTLNPLMDRLNVNRGTQRPLEDAGIKSIENIINKYDLEDVWRRRNPDCVKFTWKNSGKHQASRIDYWLISRSLDNCMKTTAIIECPFSDHDAVLIDINMNEIKRGRGYWKMNNDVIQSSFFKQKFNTFWDEWKETINRSEDIRAWWDITKIKIKQLTIWCSKEIAINKNYELTEIDYMLSKENLSEPDRQNLSQEKKKLFEIKAEGAKIRSRVNWYEKGETSSKYFHNLEKRKAKEKLWEGILDRDGNYKEGTENVINRQVEFYKELYSKGETSDQAQQKFLSNISKTLSVDSKEHLDKDITFEELGYSVQNMKQNKSPGPDGITSEFYQTFWPLIGPIFHKIINKAFVEDEMTFTQYQALITLLYKKGIREDVKNWRPISLLNCDYKIITKILSNRLRKVMHELINEDQRGCIKGRHSHDCIRILIDVIENGMDDDSCILLLDQEKAFDRVDIDWMFLVLKKMGFGEYYLKWLRIIYKNANSAIITNGYISEYFTIQRGVRQGDSLSALLYILQAEPLANEIRISPDIKGICLELNANTKEEYLLSQYVDDTNIILKNKNMIQPCLDIISDFNEASGSKTNLSKTKFLVSKDPPEDNHHMQMTKGPERALGIPIGMNIDKDQLWLSKIVRLKACLNVWKTRNLTYKGKVHLIKCYGVSNIMYTVEAVDPTQNILKEINQSLWSFLWDGKTRGKVRREICILPRKLGGLDMPDISKLISTRRVKFVLNAIQEPYEKWKFLAQSYFKTFDADYNMKYFLLKVTDSIHFIDKRVPDFYKNCIIQFQGFLKVNKNEGNDINRILNEIIWHNHQIKFNGKPLNWRHWGKSGFLRVRDIVNNNGEIDETKIRACLINRSNIMFELRIIRKAIPTEWFMKLGNKINHNLNEEPLLNEINLERSLLRTSNITAKCIYDKLVSFHSVSNKSKPYWEHKLGVTNVDWELIFLQIFNNKLLPRKIHDFNWKIFYGCLPIESRLHTMRLSDGFCKLCNAGLETLEHLFYSCSKLNNIWGKLNRIVNFGFDTDTTLDYKMIILGEQSEISVINHTINMLVSMLKWEIWLRRNEYIFENVYKSTETLWKTFGYNTKSHCKTLIWSKHITKKMAGLEARLTYIIDTV